MREGERKNRNSTKTSKSHQFDRTSQLLCAKGLICVPSGLSCVPRSYHVNGNMMQ